MATLPERLAILALTAVLLVTAACGALENAAGTAGPPTARETIQIDVCTSVPGANNIFLDYAEQKGYFAKHGLDVTVHTVEGGSDAVTALVSGSLDLCHVGGSALANAAVAGEDLLIAGGVISHLPYALVTLPEISTAEQLRGQSLAISDAGSSSDTAIRIALESLGLNPDEDVTILAVGGQGERMAAMENGAVVGTVVSVPESSRARELGYTILLDLADTDVPYQHLAVAGRKEVFENNRDMVERYMRGLAEAAAAMRDDRQGVIEVLAGSMLLDLEDDAAFLNEAYDVLLKKYFDPYPSTEGMALLLELAAADNPGAREVTAEEMIDESFISELEADGLLEGWEE